MTADSSIRRFLSVAVLIAAWICAVNHCALAAFDVGRDAPNPACPCQTEPLTEPIDDCAGDMQCGRDLNTPLPPTLAAPDLQLLWLGDIWVPAALTEPACEDPTPLALLSSPPPPAHAFLQFFLARRLLAHAPPIV